MRRAFGSNVHYGQITKRTEFFSPRPRRYSPSRVVGIDRHVIWGNPTVIGTSHVERQNLTIRMSARRFTRLTNGFSKKAEHHTAAVDLYVGHYNFCRVHETIRTTPAKAIGVTGHVWSIAELVAAATTGEAPPPPRRGQRRFRVIDGGVG